MPHLKERIDFLIAAYYTQFPRGLGLQTEEATRNGVRDLIAGLSDLVSEIGIHFETSGISKNRSKRLHQDVDDEEGDDITDILSGEAPSLHCPKRRLVGQGTEDLASYGEEKEEERGTGLAGREGTLERLNRDSLYQESHSEMQSRILEFTSKRRELVNESNRVEFIHNGESCSNDDDRSARTHMKKVDRSVQMKSSVVRNLTGPLERSVGRSRELEMDNGRADSANGDGDGVLSSGLDERITNVNRHLGLDIVSTIPLSPHMRIKIIEDKIILLEKELPEWARAKFHQLHRSVNPPSTLVTCVAASGQGAVNVVYQMAPPTTAPHAPVSPLDQSVASRVVPFGNSSGGPHTMDKSEIDRRITELKSKLLKG